MQKVRVPINSFQYGEVSDSLIMRTDTPIYAQSAQRLENMVVMSEGSVKKRYGLKHIYDYSITYDANNPAQSHLFKFIFDDNEQYIISVEHQKVRCFQLETDGTITLVETITQDVDSNALPFNQSYLQQYTYAQYGDVMFISHPLFAPRTLVRTGLTSFEIDTFAFDFRADEEVTYQPYTKFQASNVFLDPASTTGSSVAVQICTNSGTVDSDAIDTGTTDNTSPYEFELNGTLASGGTVTLDVATQVTFTATSNFSFYTFTITGTDQDGQSLTEGVIGPNSTTVYSKRFFKTITSITSNFQLTGSSLTVGVSEKQAVSYFDITGSKTGDDYLDSTHVDVTLRYGEAEMDIVSVQSSDHATVNIVDELKRRLTILNPLRTTDGSSEVQVTMFNHGFAGGEAITIEDAAPTGGINSAGINGSRTVLEIIDENTFTYTAGGTANTSEDGGGFVVIVSHAPTLDWDEQSWSAKRGYPAAVTFHENRLCFGGTLAEPDAIWMSKIGEYFNFDVGEAADTDSINLIAATGDVNEIRYMVSNRDLQVFTASGELYVPTYLNQAITPTNAQIRKQTPYGTEYVQPVSIDGATIFAQKDGKVIREYIYTDAEDAYTSSAISTLASHLIDDPKCLTVAHSGFGLPDSYAALTLGNGDMALFSSNRAERRASWTRVTTDGNFCSVVAVHDRLFANIWYDDELHLCEFDTDTGLDQWSSEVYDPLSYTGFDTTVFFTSGSTTVTVMFSIGPTNVGELVSNGLTTETYFSCAAFVDNQIISAAGMDLSDLNNKHFKPSQINVPSGYIAIEFTIDSPSASTATLTDTSGSGYVLHKNYVITSLNHGDTVDAVFTDQYTLRHDTATVVNGGVYIAGLGDSPPDPSTTVYVGRKFTSKVVSNPIDASMGAGPATGEPRGITNVIVDVKSTNSMKVNSRPSIAPAAYPESSSSFTGKKEVKLLGYSRNPQVTIEQDDPLPMQINGIVAELIV